MFCPRIIPKDVPRDHPHHLCSADDDGSQKVQRIKNKIQNIHSWTPPFNSVYFNVNRPEEIKREPPPDTKPRRSLTTCNADSAWMPLLERQAKNTIKRKEVQFQKLPQTFVLWELLPFYDQISSRTVKMHKSRAASLAGEMQKNSSNLFENRLECGIIFVKYATKTERTLRAAEMREKPI